MASTRSAASHRIAAPMHHVLPLLRHVAVAVLVDVVATVAHAHLAMRIALVVVVIAAHRLWRCCRH